MLFPYGNNNPCLAPWERCSVSYVKRRELRRELIRAIEAIALQRIDEIVAVDPSIVNGLPVSCVPS